MTTYKEIKGTQIEVLASDPSNPVEGQVWYNSTSNVLKGQAVTTAGSWATGGNLNSTRANTGGAGTQTSALAFGGLNAPVYGLAVTESYNGSAWTEVADLNTARGQMGGTGSSNTNALSFGGWTLPPFTFYANTETWNGSSWTEVSDLNQARSLGGSAGADNTSALFFGGYFYPPSVSPVVRYALTESWNGSSWTEVADLNQARNDFAGSNGTQTSALVYGGDQDPPNYSLTESWNGTSWTEVGDLNAASTAGGGAGADNTSALQFGGNPIPVVGAQTEEWNGTSWTETTDMSTGRSNITGTGTQTSALGFGGNTPPTTTTATEEWTGAGPVTRTFTDS